MFKLCFISTLLQKQSLTDVLRKRCSYKFRKFYKKKPAMESHFNKVARLQRRCVPVKFLRLVFYKTPPVPLILLLLFYQPNGSVCSIVSSAEQIIEVLNIFAQHILANLINDIST